MEVGVADVVRVGEREDRVLDGVALGVRAAEDVGRLQFCECECIIFTWCCHAATFASPMVGVRSATPLNAAPMPGPR